jgi:hypothetical protein
MVRVRTGTRLPKHAFDHGRGFGRRAALELRVDAGRFAIDVPINHDASATITGVPFSHEVLIPAPNFFESDAHAVVPSPQMWT